MMQCRGMGAVTKKGNKPKVMAEGKKVPYGMMGGKMVPGYKAGSTVKRKMKGKKV